VTDINDKPSPLDLPAKRELHMEAEDLLDEKGAFMRAVRDLRRHWFAELMAENEADRTLDLVAKLQALEAIPSQLTTYVSDYTMALRKRRA
jgi:hypothetical protein